MRPGTNCASLAGAICKDEEGNNISHEVIFGGHIVDVHMPGVYTVTYECRGVTADRTIIVKEG